MIVIDGPDAVPLVTINGEKVNGLIDVQLHWQTKDESSVGFNRVVIEHVIIPEDAPGYCNIRGWSRGSRQK